MQQIEERALQLYRRTHLPKGVPERTLILMRVMFDMLQNAGEDSCSPLQNSDEAAMPSGLVCFPGTRAILHAMELLIQHLRDTDFTRTGVVPQTKGTARPPA